MVVTISYAWIACVLAEMDMPMVPNRVSRNMCTMERCHNESISCHCSPYNATHPIANKQPVTLCKLNDGLPASYIALSYTTSVMHAMAFSSHSGLIVVHFVKMFFP